ncbi:hypothetical protein NX059_010243 [Plenodomus lindquistii]|nr:hypothetical protein NX059_010243 [Plenodomus lindquistii]
MKAQEAYEVLGDDEERATYDECYHQIDAEWKTYRADLLIREEQLEAERQHQEDKKAARQEAAEELQRRRAAEPHKCEEARKQRHETDDHDTGREAFADWAYRQAQRLKSESGQRDEEARRQEELEEEAIQCRIGEALALEAQEKRERTRSFAGEQRSNERRERQEERERLLEAFGYAPLGWQLEDTSSSNKAFYDQIFDHNGHSHWRETYHFRESELRRQAKEDAWREAEDKASRMKEEQERVAAEQERIAAEQEAIRKAKQEAAAQKKREREQVARDRKKAAKSRAADTATQAAAQRQREEQEKKARICIATKHIQHQQQEYLDSCIARGVVRSNDEVTIDIAWAKKKGKSQCLFCDDAIQYYYFVCPDGGAVACNSCKKRLSRFTPPLDMSVADEVEEEPPLSEDAHHSRPETDNSSPPHVTRNGFEHPRVINTDETTGNDGTINDDDVDYKVTDEPGTCDHGMTGTNQSTPNIAKPPIATDGKIENS